MDDHVFIDLHVTLPSASSTSSASSVAFSKTTLGHLLPPDAGFHPTEIRMGLLPTDTPTWQSVGDHHIDGGIALVLTAATVAAIVAWHVRRSAFVRYVGI